MKFIKEATKQDMINLEEEINNNFYNKKYLHAQPYDFSRLKNLSQGDSLWNKWFSILNEERKVVGMIQMSRLEYRQRIIFGIIIFKEHQKKGHGSRALKEFFDFCKNIGIQSIECFTTNKRLENFYKNLGMKKIGIFKKRRKLSNGKIYDELIFERLLGK